MAGTRVGGLKSAAKNKARYGDDFYERIGAKGGKSSRSGGFAANRELAREAGSEGGRISKRDKEIEKAVAKKQFEILSLAKTGLTSREIANKVNLPFHSTDRFLRKKRKEVDAMK